MVKKNNRENWWLVYFFAALFVLFVGFWWLNYINITPDINIQNPKPPNPNAYDYYLSAASSVVDSGKVAYALDKRPKNWIKTTTEPNDRYYSTAEKEAIVKKNAAAFKTFRKGFNYEYLDPVAWQPYSVYGFFGSFAKLRSFARLIRLESDVYAEKSDYKGAVNCCIDGIRFGNDIYKGGNIIGCLVGEAVESITRADVKDYADHVNAKEAKFHQKDLKIY